jgi:hypothetical protein
MKGQNGGTWPSRNNSKGGKIMKPHYPYTLFVLFMAVLIGSSWLPKASAGGAAQNINLSTDNLWQELDEAALTTQPNLQTKHQTLPLAYRAFRLNPSALTQLLAQAPMEFTEAAQHQSVVMTLPMPDGALARFRIVESPVMEPELAAKVPHLKTYTGQGLDDPTAVARFDWTPAGFHAIVLSANGTVYVDPYQGDTNTYLTFYRHDISEEDLSFECQVSEMDAAFIESRRESDQATPTNPSAPNIIPPNGAMLRTFRMAVAASGEYTNYFRQMGDTDDQAKNRALAGIMTTINRLNTYYERELAIRFVLIADELRIIYTDPNTDPYNNRVEFEQTMVNQTNLDNVIGTANYDIGHVFVADGAGGNAPGPVCINGLKAHGVTGLRTPDSPRFAALLRHEVGHQCGSGHTYNGTAGPCAAARFEDFAYEPGSGSTIMAYFGLCDSQNLTGMEGDYFHVKSLENMIASVTRRMCAVETPTGNRPPTVNAGANVTIPRRTPFTLTATANDPDGDALTYCWEEYDLGPASPPDSDADGQARPIFRSFQPTANPARTFPSLQYILNNANVPPANLDCGDGFRTNCIAGEVLPSIGRTMNFQVTVRDNRAGGGGISSAQVQVVVDGNSGPLAVTQPNAAVTWAPGSQQMVTWNVANTNQAPVSCANVRILLSTDGGQTFPTTLAESVPNNGAATITVPNVATTTARIKVAAVGNIFFDISDANFTIGMGGGGPETVALMSGVAQNGTIPAPTGGVALGQTQYTIQVPAGATQLKVDLNGNPNVDLYVRFGQRVVIQNRFVADFRSESLTGTETITITPASTPPLRAGTYYIAVANYGPGASTFTVTATVR